MYNAFFLGRNVLNFRTGSGIVYLSPNMPGKSFFITQEPIRLNL